MSNILVAYFSASGITKGVSKKMADLLNADIFEIVPKELYTDEDLNWMNKQSRSSVEMNDINFRPEIKNKIDITKYDYIFIGFPIWWYREPSIIDTFLEQYDFSNKIIIPFATSGGSSLGNAPKNMQNIVKNAVVKNGKRLSNNISNDELFNWINSEIN